MQVDSRLQGKFDTSDVVQQTLMEAWRSAAKFRGSTEAERIAWLRKILAHVSAHEVRQYRGTHKRDLGREMSIERSLAKSSRQLNAVFASATTSPSQQAAQQEQQVVLADMLQELPADYREVIVLRNLEGLSHSEVAQRMGRTVGAVRMLWLRRCKSCGNSPSGDNPERSPRPLGLFFTRLRFPGLAAAGGDFSAHNRKTVRLAGWTARQDGSGAVECPLPGERTKPRSAMSHKILNQIREAVLAGRYALSEHAYDEDKVANGPCTNSPANTVEAMSRRGESIGKPSATRGAL